MARGRMINKGISLSPKFDSLVNDATRLLATWTIPHLDKRGVFHGNPQIVKSLIFPLRQDISTQEVAAMIEDMERVGLIRRFEQGGRVWQVWPGFADNQKGLHAEREGTDFPPPPDDSGRTPATAGLLPAKVQQLPELSGQSGPEVEVEVQVEKEGEEEARQSAPAAPAIVSRRVSGFASVITEHSDARVAAYLDLLAQKDITDTNAALIMERVGENDIELWREVLRAWAVGGDKGPYVPTNFRGLFSRFDSVKNAKRFTKTIAPIFAGTRGRPVMYPQVPDPTPAEFAAAEARAKAQREARNGR